MTLINKYIVALPHPLPQKKSMVAIVLSRNTVIRHCLVTITSRWRTSGAYLKYSTTHRNRLDFPPSFAQNRFSKRLFFVGFEWKWHVSSTLHDRLPGDPSIIIIVQMAFTRFFTTVVVGIRYLVRIPRIEVEKLPPPSPLM